MPATGSAVDDPALVDKPVLARVVSTSTRTLDNWMREKKIPFVKISPRMVRFSIPAVLKALGRFEVKEAK